MQTGPSRSAKESPRFQANPFVVLNRTVYFNGECDTCRPYCGAICCSAYGFVGLSEEEAKSGKFEYREATDDCTCDSCKRMRELGLRFMLPKHPDGSCVYLDGTRKCSIYEDRPDVCRNYTCVNIPFAITPAG